MKKVRTFQERLKELLTIHNITAAKLSKDTKIDKSLISRYLSGKCEAKQENLEAIAKYFNVSYGYLLGYDVSISETLCNDIINLLKSFNNEQLISVKKFIDTFILNNSQKSKEEK